MTATLPTIPVPGVLDATRPFLATQEARGEYSALVTAFEAGSDYGAQMWHVLSSVREFLASHHPDVDDAVALHAWRDVYVDVVAVMCSRYGNSGYADDEARAIQRADMLQIEH